MHDADYYHFFEAEYFELLHDLREEIAAMMDLRSTTRNGFPAMPPSFRTTVLYSDVSGAMDTAEAPIACREQSMAIVS